MIRFDPLLPGWLTVLVIALLAASAAWTYRRGGWPALPRAAAVALAVLMLLGPMWVEPQRQGEPPRLALVCDSSASMARADAPGGRDRLDAARAALAAAAAAAGPGWKVEHWSLSDRLVPGSAASASGATSFAALAALAGERAPAAVVFASDGADPLPDGPEAALAAARIPVFALAVGGATAAANAAVRLDLASPTAFPGQEVEAVAVVSCSPGLAGRQAELRWSGPGAPTPATVTLADGLRVTHALPAGAAAGEVVWSVELSPLPGEATLADNRADAALRVVDRRLRLAVLEGRPAWDTAFAVRAWRRDRQLEVVARWKLGERVLVSGGDPAAPPFAGAAVVALGDDRLLDAATAAELVRFVAGGGGLLLLSPAGDQGRDGALAALDPLTATRGAAQA
ncbi:MAG: hypothetical protein L6R48_25750, partial [Planctomycetes bacterium]|nr:hypothetical protein [Planctomycetota bacterium]